MDRYKFEDSISSYLDNEMNLKERQEFEDYMNENPEAKSLFENVKNKLKTVMLWIIYLLWLNLKM